MTARDVAAFSAALKLELPDLVFSYIDPGMAAITYFDALEYVNSGRRFSREASTAFLRPANWQPQWVVSDPDPGAYFRYKLVNLPAQYFTFRCSLCLRRVSNEAGLAIEVYREAPLHATYDQNDLVVRRFVDRIYRLHTKFVTKDLAVIEPSTRRIVKNINYWYWTGHDVLLNCRKHENRYIDLAYCDERTGERFFFGPREDWSPPNWLVDLEESEGSSR